MTDREPPTPPPAPPPAPETAPERGPARALAAAGGRLVRWLGEVGRRRVSARRLGRWFLVALAVLLPSAAWGVATASTVGSLGPHVARYDVTLDGSVTVDLGPLGTIVIDSPLPAGIGARVVVQEIPAEVTAIDAATSLESLGRAVEGYVAFFNGPEATVELAVRGLVGDAVRRTAGAAGLLTLALLALRLALGRERRAELADAWRPRRGAIGGGTVVVALVVATVAGSGVLTTASDDERTASAVFDGTPLEGARITGRLAGVVDTYGGYAVDAWRDNEAFYAAADEAVRSAWRARQESDLRLVSNRFAPDDEDAEEPVTAVVVSDLHCNVGMADVIRSVVELSGATLVLNAGDTTVNGTAVESYCVETFADAIPDGVTTVVSNGNHDSPDTTEQELDAEWVVLEGEVVEVQGIRILGDADPRATRIGSGTSLVGEETVAGLSERLAEAACADEDVDLLLVHDPVVGEETLTRGCAPAQISGHYHQRIGPVRFGEGTRYTSTSTAGARLGQATLGPLSGVAELTVLRFDAETHRIVDYRLVRVLPDATATVTVALQWPAQPVRHLPDVPLR